MSGPDQGREGYLSTMTKAHRTIARAQRDLEKSVNESLRLEGEIIKLRREQTPHNERAEELRAEIHLRATGRQL